MSKAQFETAIATYGNSSKNVRQKGYEVIHDFEKGRVYWEIDLGNRYAVEALAKLLKRGDTSVFEQFTPTYQLASEITDRATFCPGSVAAFVRKDGDTEVATIFVDHR